MLFSAIFPLFIILIFSSCADIQKPKIEQFYGEVKPPGKKQEFRWSNGKLPKQLDPALASAPPETDLVRAVYEGLTDLDARTLDAQPSVAENWEITDDGRTWTFHLRKDAKWTNEQPVTARDFVRSWRRLAEMGAAVPHSKLLKNIVGAENFSIDDGISILPPEEFESEVTATPSPANTNSTTNTANSNTNSAVNAQRLPIPTAPKTSVTEPAKENADPKAADQKAAVQKWLGVEALDDLTLRVWLIQPDRNFSAVVAHPVFRPVYEDTSKISALDNSPQAVTNGAFQVSNVSKEEVTLTRSNSFWGREGIGLEKVRLIAKPDEEAALAAYQANEIDAITNTHFEPLALKLLTPFEDFRRSTHNALTYYQFNVKHHPFDDARVRRALAMAVERERIVQDEMGGAGEAATDYLPFVKNETGAVEENVDKAKALLSEAGFADTTVFPEIRLLINRNDLQRRIANSIVAMWKKVGVRAVVIMKDRVEYEEAIRSGEYDLVRRGVVLPTANETSSLLAMFDPIQEINDAAVNGANQNSNTAPQPSPTQNISELPDPLRQMRAESDAQKNEAAQTRSGEPKKIFFLTEKQALENFPAIPLYFPVSNSLVKPYVNGFYTNLLDAPSLKTIVIDDQWKRSSPQR